MNLAIFSRLVRRAWTEVMIENPGYEYSYDDVLNIFRYFFFSYKEHCGEDHPNVKQEQIKRYILLMPIDGRDDGCSYELLPEDYPPIIDAYFQTKFDGKCDYRLAHFFSGDIRLYRYYERIYRGE